MAVTDLLTALRAGGSVFGAELRPPRAELATHEGMDAWIDTYHAVRRLTRQGTFVFLTDSAVGSQEEDNLRHLAKDPNEPNLEHVHTVVRTPNGNDYGKDLRRQHYAKHPHPHAH